MLLKDMFAKKIDRDIQGVIIVGQGEETNVSQELDEYVVTRELQKHFADFFSAYKKGILGTTPKMGAWISGFFGSGKSHFLKILSYLLANKQVGDKCALDYFSEDKKIVDPMVLADMKLAAETPTDVVLFNIDSKSDTGSKQNKDAIVNVFLRVFNEMQGFCGALPHLADLEQQLTEAGRMEEFKEAFEDDYGKPWEENRHKFDFIQDTVVDVLVDMDFMSEAAARNWCEKASEPYQISIEDFAKRVKAYIKAKGNNHHVVFLVDEIGQYIGEDSKLMLNLQTVTEELGKECQGKAWVIVTSQQDIDSVTKVKGNDFSKIQGRFDTRLSLSSANVDAVIKKRILDKTDTAAQTLRLLYDQKATIIKNLIVFNDGVEKKLYASGNDFSEVYPFVPYQFNLLASVLTSIRTHGASGKHLSEGERSMLALFKESAARLKDMEMGVIVPFHLFYDALENFLDHNHRGVIIRAYDNSKINPEHKESDVFTINVLKTLFMIKYVLEIEANIDNITSLMISNIDDDRIELKDKVETALKVLMQQMLVQKNGSIYVFLTDEEQEINREIDSQNVEMPEVINKVSEMIFEDIFSDKRYRYPAFNGRYSFAFNQIVDDRPYKANQNYDVGLRILTPWYEGGNDDATLRMISGQGKEVLVVLPNDAAFLDELRMYLKIEKFLRLNTSAQLTKYETIKEAKRVEMRERNFNARLYLTEALKEAVIYVNADTMKTSAKEVTRRINEAIGRLVQTVYHKLTYIDTAYGESDIRKMFRKSNQLTLNLEGGTEANVHALDDVLAFISGNTRVHMKTSMKTVKDRFMKAPYGFVEDDVQWLIARLFKRGDLAFTVNGANVNLNNKSQEEIISYITKKAFVEKLLMEERVRVAEKDKKAVRDVMKEVFRTGSVAEDEDTIMKNFQRYAQNLINEMLRLEPQYQRYAYPGKKVIDSGKRLMQSVIEIQAPLEFFQYVSKKRETFYDFAEDYEPVKAFFGGEQQEIFTMHAWMFLSSFEKLRIRLQSVNLINMAHLGARAFDEIGGEVVQTTAFVIRNSSIKALAGRYSDLRKYSSEKAKEVGFLSKGTILELSQDYFNNIPGAPLAYWLNENAFDSFLIGKPVSEYADFKQGMSTANNDKFLRLWFEVIYNGIMFNAKSENEAINSKKRWFPHTKGGSNRKWYGNNDYLVNWYNGGEEIKKYPGSATRNTKYYFKEGLTWSTLASGPISFRYTPTGFTMNTKGSICYLKDDFFRRYIQAFLNSKVAMLFLSLLAPTLDYSQGPVGKLPLIIEQSHIGNINKYVDDCVFCAKDDWDSFEISWDFKTHPLANTGLNSKIMNSKYSKVENCYLRWSDECNARFERLKTNEIELNKSFIEIYGLQNEMTPEVEDKYLTIRHADVRRDIKSLLSYAVGCMFGRYSLDIEGLAYAGGKWDSSMYISFIPDDDNVIPITDEEYLEDDIVSRLCTWLKVVYSEETLEENLDFISKALGNKGDSSRDIIRNYFVKEFFKDHCNTYSITGSGKRPIYWLFDSGKQNGFKALIYLHRYTPDTIGNLRIDYLHRMQRVYESEISRMQDMIDHSTNAREVGQATKRKDKLIKQIKECREYDEKLAHLALSRIELNLDDGVKVNYRKIQTANDGKFYEVLADSKKIMAKK